MQPLELSEDSQQRLRVAQLIVIALVLGVMTFAAVAMVVATPASAPPGSPPGPGAANPDIALLRIIAAAMLFMAAPAGLLIKRSRIASFERSDAPVDADLLMPVYFTTTLIAVALLEAAALFACVIIIIGGGPPDLLVVGAAVGLMLLHMPSRSRLEHTLDAIDRRRSLHLPAG